MIKVIVRRQQTVNVQAAPPVCTAVKADAPVIVVDGGGHPDYTGPTVVVPQAYRQTVLPTTGTILQDDITVDKVPYYAVSNQAGGQTVYIADNLEVS